MKQEKLSFQPNLARSFYLTLRVLPGRIRYQVTLAYFMARAADTVADTAVIEAGKRKELLTNLRACLDQAGRCAGVLGEMASDLSAAQPSGAEREIIEKLPLMYEAHHRLEVADRERATRLLSTLLDGMIFDLIRFPPGSETRPNALRTRDELSRYTYLVAGVVGEYWSEMLAHHFRAIDRTGLEEMKRLGMAFGQGLQLINVLRDLPRDLANGRCYLPLEDLAPAGLNPSDLASGEARAKFRPIFREKLALTESSLRSGLSYLRHIPRSMVRNRLAVALPLLIGAATLRELRRLPNPLAPEAAAKIARSELYRILLFSLLLAPSNRAIARLYARLTGFTPHSPASARWRGIAAH